MTQIVDFVMGLVDRLGYAGLALVIALENVFPPIPSEAILPLAGFNAHLGDFSFGLVVLFATIGSVFGALVLYGVGAWLGEARLRRFVARYGRFALLTEKDVDAAHGWFQNHGRLAVLICRCVPIVRSLISIPAGVERMPVVPFVVFTAIGSAVWNTLLAGAGWVLGSQWELVEQFVEKFQVLVALALAVAIVWFIWKRFPGRVRNTAER